MCAGLLLVWGVAQASLDRIEVNQAVFESRDDGYYFSGDFELELKPRIAEALDRGLTLYFVVEVELTRSRWYWFDEKTVNATLNYRLSYHALTRQYRVSTGNLQLGLATLPEALGVIAHVRDWKVAERSILRPGETYATAVRMRLDTTQLPKPFQINAITNRDWTLESDWKRSTFEPR
ncbi:MAG: DUF4390 domain-containing protein [Burkholderiaceae bacterium]